MQKDNGNLMIAQIYVDSIMFEGMSSKIVDHFVSKMQVEFEMRMVGEITYFLGFQVKQMEYGIFISQSKYAKNIKENLAQRMQDISMHLLPLMSSY